MKKIILLLLVFNIMAGHSQTNKNTSAKIALQKSLVGDWQLVSVINIYPDQNRVYPYGDAPQGKLIFDDKGNYALQIYRALRTNVVSGDKNKCTPEENAAMVQGSNAHFGKYLVNETDHTITFNIEQASFPNWNMTSQKRSYTYTGTEFKYVVTHTTQGGQAVVAEVTWKR